ncbi:cytochrome P450 [Streptomyces sp. NPDC055078]
MTTHSDIPVVPGALPLVGHFPQMARSGLDFFAGLYRHGDLVEFRLGRRSVVMVCDPDLARYMLLHDRVFDKDGPQWDRLRDLVGNGLVACPAAEHRSQRRLMQPTFQRSCMPGYAAIMTDHISGIVSGWHDGQLLDIGDEMLKISTGVVLATILGADLDTAAHARMGRDVSTVLTGNFWGMILPDPLVTVTIARRYNRARHRLRRDLRTRIAGTHHDDGTSLLSRLLTARDRGSDGYQPTDSALVDQCMTLLIAGTETTSNTLLWSLSLLSQHPKTQHTLTQEADSVLAGRTATWEDLPRLKYTRQVLDETLRLCPPAWLITRTVSTDTRLGTHALAAGTTLAYSPYLLGRLPSLYPRPEEFDPARWATETPRQRPSGYLPFAAGARQCIGDEFALMQATLVLASITSRWQLCPVPGPRGMARPVARNSLGSKPLLMTVSAHTER